MSDYYPEPPLFSASRMEFRDPKVLARATDPATSHAAAAKATTFKGEHRRRILESLAAGPAGQSEIARRTGLTIAAVSKRLGEMRRDGDIERCGECRSASGGREGAYRISAASR